MFQDPFFWSTVLLAIAFVLLLAALAGMRKREAVRDEYERKAQSIRDVLTTTDID